MTDRFELFELLREHADALTYRARERATGRAVEVHLLASPDAHQPSSAIDSGTHDGKSYVVTLPAAAEADALNSAGAWKVRTPPVPTQPTPEPGDFTRMFQLKQAPELEPVPAKNPKPAVPAASSQQGDFTRAIQRPAAPTSAAPDNPPGQAGDFTRMFQQPAAPASVPQVPEPASKPRESRSPARFSAALIVGVILVLCAIVVFVLMR